MAKATLKSQEKSDLIRNLVSFSELLCYKCNQQCFKSVKFKDNIQTNSINGHWSHIGSRSRCVWCPWRKRKEFKFEKILAGPEKKINM